MAWPMLGVQIVLILALSQNCLAINPLVWREERGGRGLQKGPVGMAVGRTMYI